MASHHPTWQDLNAWSDGHEFRWRPKGRPAPRRGRAEAGLFFRPALPERSLRADPASYAYRPLCPCRPAARRGLGVRRGCVAARARNWASTWADGAGRPHVVPQRRADDGGRPKIAWRLGVDAWRGESA